MSLIPARTGIEAQRTEMSRNFPALGAVRPAADSPATEMNPAILRMKSHRLASGTNKVAVEANARDVGVYLAAFLVAQELAAAFRGEHEMNDDVGEGLGHGVGILCGALASRKPGCFYQSGCKPAM